MKKKSENKEQTMADASGSFEAPLSGTILKKDIENLSNFDTKKQDVNEMEGIADMAYDAPPKGLKSKDPLKLDNPKTVEKQTKAVKDKNWPKFGGDKGVYVKPKEKCKKFPYCNQGNTGSLEFYESKAVQLAIKNASEKYGIPIQEIKKIVLNKLINEALPKGIFDDPDNLKALKGWVDKGEKKEFHITTEQPLDLKTTDDVDIAKLKLLFYKYDVKFTIHEIKK